MTLTACSPKCEPKIIEKPIEVVVETKCIVPDTNCTSGGNSPDEVVGNLLKCIIDLRQASKVCQ
ncbi:Rz-like spanin [Thiohalocapsa phage LS06-2018-MD03]|nr:Rz-like spanin [Thiohalocapsa phage LS06-2018-MD03]